VATRRNNDLGITLGLWITSMFRLELERKQKMPWGKRPRFRGGPNIKEVLKPAQTSAWRRAKPIPHRSSRSVWGGGGVRRTEKSRDGRRTGGSSIGDAFFRRKERGEMPDKDEQRNLSKACGAF